MKKIYSITVFLFSLNLAFSQWTKLVSAPVTSVVAFRVFQAVRDSSEFYRFVNATSLKRLPAIIRDLNIVLNRSKFNDVDFLNGKGFTIYLSDLDSKSFEKSGITQKISDTLYHVSL